jgi:hypothetical protein
VTTSAAAPPAVLEHHESYLAGVLALLITEVIIVRADGVSITTAARLGRRLSGRQRGHARDGRHAGQPISALLAQTALI